MRVYTSLWFSFLLLFHLFMPLDCKRGGMSMGRTSGSRGSSASRSGSGGGLFGSKSRPAPAATNYQRNTNYGGQQSGSGGWGAGSSSGSSWGKPAGSGSGWNNNYNKPRTSSGLFGGGGHRPHRYSKGSGIGSMVRSNTFKNAIVGAAAGYLTYQAGKHIIRSMAGPMMWGNRNYYWGSNYYRPSVGQNQMCRMPIDSSDQQFGNVYFQDQTRPREIVWGCGHYEYCCGYECCRGGSASTYGYGSSVGYAFVLYYIIRAYVI